MRLDNFLVENGFFDSRTKAKQAVMRGEIYVNSKVVTKPAYIIEDRDKTHIEYMCDVSFVSLGGYKLNKAIDDFNFNCTGLIAFDIGASTGGFTDCLLKRGAKRVYAIDLNESLLHEKLKSDSRVVEVIKNARELKPSDFCESPDLIVADLSFISVTYVIDVFSRLLESGKSLIILVKPQFEVGQKRRFKNGIVRDDKIRAAACESVINAACDCGFAHISTTTAPIIEGKNVEYLILFRKL